ncbi:MAG: V-type ATP synthase subunit E [Candidatus Thorarchaeota archaeon]|jgi:V/A-type H+-transporting ATPase subunit E
MEGVTNIIEIIKAKTKEECDKVIAEAEEFKKQRLEKAKERARVITEEIAGKAEREADSEVAKYHASAMLQAKYRLLESKEAIMTEVFSTAWDNIQKSVLDKKYDKTVFALAVDGGISLQEPDVEVVLPEGQKVGLTVAELGKAISKESGVKTKVSMSKDTIRATGGVVVRTTDGTKWVDNTYDARKERLDAELRDRVAAALFTEKTSE